MTCDNCEATLEPQQVSLGTGGVSDNEIEVRFACQDCKQGYYTFVSMDHFVRDAGAPGKPITIGGRR